MQFLHDWRLLVASDAVLIDPESSEAGDVQVSADGVRCRGVGTVRIVEKSQVPVKHRRTDPEFVAGLLHSFFGGHPLDLYRAQSGTNLLARQCRVFSEVKQLFLANGEPVKLLPVSSVDFTQVGLLIVQSRSDGLGDGLTEVVRQPETYVVIGDVPLDLLSRQIRQVALTFALQSDTTGEVVVVVTTTPLGLGEDHAAGPAVLSAAIAVHQSLEVVVMHAITLSAL